MSADASAIPAVLILGLLPWLVIILIQINQRGFLVLCIWLLTAPIAINIFNHPTSNPFFGSSASPDRIQQILEPARLVFIALVLVGAINAAMNNKRLTALDRTEMWMAVFSLVLLTNVLLKSRQVAFGLHVAVDAFMLPFTAYYLTRRLVRSELDLRRLIRVFGWLGFYLIGIALIEFNLSRLAYLHRLQGPFATRDLLYIVIMVAFFAMLGLVGSKDYSKQKPALAPAIQWFVVALAPVIIFLTWTRGNWLGFISGTWLALFLGRQFFSPYVRVYAIGFTLILLPAVGFLATQVSIPSDIEGRIADSFNAQGRLVTWRIALESGSTNPILGIGLNNLRDVLDANRINVPGTRSLTTHHNGFLGLFIELGAVGLFIYLLIVSSIIRTGLKIYRSGLDQADRWRGIVVIAMMIAYLIPGFFSTILYSPELSHIYVFAYAGGVAGLYGSRRRVQDMSRRSTTLARPVLQVRPAS